jgi:multisubunit Na+/H+ antiporter MnhC subunit
MSGQMTVFTTATLVQVVPNLKRAQKFLLDKFFLTLSNHRLKKSILMSILVNAVWLLLLSVREGKMVESRKYQTNRFKPAYVKDKRALIYANLFAAKLVSVSVVVI